jgi:hypothetical protein
VAQRPVSVRRTHHQDHADPHVECPERLGLGKTRRFDESGEDRRHRPCPLVHNRNQSARQDSREISTDSAPRDVRHGPDPYLAGKGEHRANVDPRGAEQFLGHRRTPLRDTRRHPLFHPPEDDLSRERVPVAVKPRGGKSDQCVSRPHGASGDDPLPVDGPHREPRQVEFPCPVHGRHLGGLSSEKGASGLSTPFRDPRDDFGSVLRGELPRGVVIEKEQGFGAVDQDVVHAHGHEVDAHRPEPSCHRGDLHLGPHAVRARYEYGIAVFSRVEPEESRKSSDATQNLPAVRRPDDRADEGNQAVPLVDVHARGAVCDCFFHDFSPRKTQECTPTLLIRAAQCQCFFPLHSVQWSGFYGYFAR